MRRRTANPVQSCFAVNAMNLHVSFGGSVQEQLCRLQHGILLPATFDALPRCLFGGVYADVNPRGVKGSELTPIRP